MRRPVVTIVVVLACLSAMVVIAAVGWPTGIFKQQVSVIVVNDLGRSVDLTCLQDNRDGLAPDRRTALWVDAGTTEDCEVDAHDGRAEYGCLVLEAQGWHQTAHEIRLSQARTNPRITCSV